MINTKFGQCLVLSLFFFLNVSASSSEERQDLPTSIWSVLNWKIGRLLDFELLGQMTQRYSDTILLATDYSKFKEMQRKKISDKMLKQQATD